MAAVLRPQLRPCVVGAASWNTLLSPMRGLLSGLHGLAVEPGYSMAKGLSRKYRRAPMDTGRES
jgi:hypothetical protein